MEARFRARDEDGSEISGERRGWDRVARDFPGRRERATSLFLQPRPRGVSRDASRESPSTEEGVLLHPRWYPRRSSRPSRSSRRFVVSSRSPRESVSLARRLSSPHATSASTKPRMVSIDASGRTRMSTSHVGSKTSFAPSPRVPATRAPPRRSGASSRRACVPRPSRLRPWRRSSRGFPRRVRRAMGGARQPPRRRCRASRRTPR